MIGVIIYMFVYLGWSSLHWSDRSHWFINQQKKYSN